MRILASIVFACLALVAACGANNPACPDGVCPGIDAPVDVAVACMLPQMPCDQNSTTPFCVDGSCVGCQSATDCATLGDDRMLCLKNPPGAMYGECVECNENGMQAPDVGSATDECQTPGLQVCDATSHTCRTCALDAECTSGICAGGTCIAAADIAYVAPAPAGTNNTMCTSTMKCLTVQAGVDTGRSFVLVAPGTYVEADDVDLNNRNTTIRATGATISGMAANREAVHVHGSSQVVIEGGTFDGMRHANQPVISHDGASSTLTLVGVTVTNSAVQGIVSSTRLTVRNSTVTDNDGIGIDVTAVAQPFELTRSTISHNDGGGVRFSSATAIVMNNFIIKNCSGNQCTPFNIVALTTPGSSRIEFNTIANNLADTSSNGGGVTCAAGTTVIRNSILFSNPGLNQAFGCTVRFSTIQGATPDVANGIINDAPNFVATGSDNFHLMPGSAGLGKADPNADLTGPGAVDFDGQPRPQGGAPADLGADEIP